MENLSEGGSGSTSIDERSHLRHREPARAAAVTTEPAFPMPGAPIGDYRILQHLGEGGTGRVFVVEHARLQTRHVLKLLHAQLSKNRSLVAPFLSEARAAGATGHRNLVEITHIDRIAGDGSWFLVMPHRDGATLATLMAARTRPFEQRVIVHILGEALHGLESAHGRQIIHRDLKPSNLLVARVDADAYRTSILDFGVAQLGDAAGIATRTGAPIRERRYLAPEQHRGVAIDARADLWAIGAIAYEMATGRPACHDVDPRRHNPALTDGFVTAMMQALDPDPGRRPASARALARMLAEATPAEADHPSGVEILRTHAAELLAGHHPPEISPALPPAAAPPSRYELGARLGGGGMAEVFLATVRGVEGFTRTVALKRVLPGLSERPQFSTMFIDEARIAMRLVHENVVAVTDFDRDDAGRLFLVMELVSGKDLATLIESGAVPASVAIFLTIKVLRGLGHAHELLGPAGNTCGVIHRDVSPQNVLVSWQGAVKVSDFGIAKTRDASGAAHSSALRGKPGYLSPEQASGEPLDPRSDLFAVGIVLWEMLTGRRLFGGGTRETIGQLLFRDAPSVRTAGVRLSADLERVLRKLLARDRDDRYPSAARAIEALTRCRDHPRDGESELVRLLAARFPADAQGGPTPPPRSDARITHVEPSPRVRVDPPRVRRRWLALGICLVASLAASGVAWLASQAP